MNILPAGYYDSSDDGSGFESGFSENSVNGAEVASPAVALREAIQEGRVEDVESILGEIVSYERFALDNGLRPLVYAASVGQPSVVDLLLRYDAANGVENEAYASYTPLMAACSGGDEPHSDDADRSACVDSIVSAGFDPNFRDRFGETALMRACKCAAPAVVELLLRRKAAVNDRDNDGWSPLFYAASRGDSDVVRVLLAHGADKTGVDKRNRLPRTIAAEKGFAEIADALEPDEDGVADDCSFRQNGCSIYDADDVHYRDDVLQMVASAASSSSNVRRNVPLFRDKRLTLREFLLLKTDRELEDVGVLFSGHRKKILARIKQFHLGTWSPEAFGLSRKSASNPLLEVLTFTATLHRQLYVLRTSLKYVETDFSSLGSADVTEGKNLLKDAKLELLRFNNRLKLFQRFVRSIRCESHSYLTAEEISD